MTIKKPMSLKMEKQPTENRVKFYVQFSFNVVLKCSEIIANVEEISPPSLADPKKSILTYFLHCSPEASDH